MAEAALGALGMLTIARPSIMVDKASPSKKILKAALQPGAPELLKLKALSNLIELLRADEASMRTAQADGSGAEGGGGGVLLPTVAGGAGPKKRGGKKAAAQAAGGEHAVQTQNGEGDTLSQSSSILQVGWLVVVCMKACGSKYAGNGCLALWPQCHWCCPHSARVPASSWVMFSWGMSPTVPQVLAHQCAAGACPQMMARHPLPPSPPSCVQDNWDAVLRLATDTSPSPPGSALSPPGSAGGDLAPGTHVRRRVIELMEIVLR